MNMKRTIIRYNPNLKQRARELRNNSTLGEILLFQENEVVLFTEEIFVRVNNGCICFQYPCARHETQDVKLIIYNSLGKEVEILVNEKLSNGCYEVDWNASGYSSGVYFYKLFSNDFTLTKKMLLIK